MKVHQYTVYVLDFEDYGDEEYATIMEQHRHLNARVTHVDSHEIGEWDDDHPLNRCDTDYDKYFKEVFG